MRKKLCVEMTFILVAALLAGCKPAQKEEAVPATESAAAPAAAATAVTPTNITVTNNTKSAAYATIVLGQPPASPPANCTSLGEQITSISDARLVFNSSVSGKTVTFTPQATGITTKGYYQMAAGETITYVPQTFTCPKGGTCSPAVTFNFFFTAGAYNGNPNNGCGGSTTFPNATNLAEASINFGINGSSGSSCANADAADISAVNGINASLALSLSGDSWPFTTAANGNFGTNANKQGVYGWASTNCVNSAGYPNPSANCAVPAKAPKAVQGQCKTPGGAPYTPITDPTTKVQYCAEISDSTTTNPQGLCVSQRPGGVTGGTVAISFNGFL
jgi:hypothetical protein